MPKRVALHVLVGLQIILILCSNQNKMGVGEKGGDEER